MTDPYWFTPKTHGYGAYPKNGKGWVAMLGFIGLQLAAASLLIGGGDESTAAWRSVLWAGIAAVTTIGFVLVCRAKTDGPWRWRWPKATN